VTAQLLTVGNDVGHRPADRTADVDLLRGDVQLVRIARKVIRHRELASWRIVGRLQTQPTSGTADPVRSFHPVIRVVMVLVHGAPQRLNLIEPLCG
jgi:hypothetical protein